MASGTPDPFDHAVRTAGAWLTAVGQGLSTDNRRFAYRVLRAWLHTLRDRLTVEAAAKFGAQLPELLRGVYYEGWEPSKAPVKYGPGEYRRRFAHEAQVPDGDVPVLAAAVTATLAARLSPGQMGEVLAQLPAPLRATMHGAAAPVARPAPPPPPEQPIHSLVDAEKALSELKVRVDNLTEAVRTLAGGFDEVPGARGDNGHRIRAARLAAEILMSEEPPAAPNGSG
jgi:uncharacterized protein (DUF2267 family)